ncbi:MAG TPA: hypothetical protein VIF62_20630, partial [Labilithrix sp.]
LGTIWAWAIASFEPTDVPVPAVEVGDGWLACEGAGLVGAAPYDKASGAKNVYDAFRRPLDKAFFDDATEIFGGNFDLTGYGKNPAVVVCESRTRGKKVKSCKFEGGKSLTVYAATWTMRLAEAKTGAVLAERTFKEEKRPFCPGSWNFERDGDEMDLAPIFDKFVMPVLTPK